jgi:hypothetical protein
MVVVSHALLMFMSINASRIFEFHMLVVVVAMLNILELIRKIVPKLSNTDIITKIIICQKKPPLPIKVLVKSAILGICAF